MIKDILALGVPTFVRQGGMSIVFIVMNNSLGHYGGDIHIAIFGLIFRILHFILLPVFGLVQGFQPITGYNYGAGNTDRVIKTVKFTLIISAIISSFAFLIIMLFPGPIFHVFTTDTELINSGIPILRIIILIIPFIGVQVIGSSYFMAIGKAGPAFFLGLSRQFIFLLPLLIVFPLWFGLWGVFSAFPAADFISTLLTGIWFLYDVNKLKNKPIKKVVPV